MINKINNNKNIYKIGDTVYPDLATLYVTAENKVDGCAILTYGNIGHNAIIPEHIEEGSVWEVVDDVRCLDKQVCKIVDIEEDEYGNIAYTLLSLNECDYGTEFMLSGDEMQIACSQVV